MDTLAERIVLLQPIAQTQRQPVDRRHFRREPPVANQRGEPSGRVEQLPRPSHQIGEDRPQRRRGERSAQILDTQPGIERDIDPVELAIILGTTRDG